MGRAMRWIRKVFTAGKKEGDNRDGKEHGFAGGTGPPVEKRRWSFARPRSSVADGGRRASVTAVVAGELSQVRPCSCGQGWEVEAAVVIQKAFRGYLARKALRALKSLVKLQALVRGYLVRKQAATTLRRLQALMRLQASTHALKTASSRKSVEQFSLCAQERIIAHDVARLKPLPHPLVHRRRLSDGGDTAFDRCSPRIVEMDTCQLRCRSSRITTNRYAADPMPPNTSPLLYVYSQKQAAARLLEREREPPLPKTTHNTPRLGSAFPGGGGGGYFLSSPAKGGTSPRYMADTASSVARCRSAPKQRNEAARHSVGSRKQQQKQARPALSQQDSFSFKSSEATSRVGDSEFSDEVARDYYLDRFW